MEWLIVFFLTVIILPIFYFYRKNLIDQIKLLKAQALLEDLEIATRDQLLQEFRKRPNNLYILLRPIINKNEQGLKIEINGFSPYDGISLLHLATTVVFREMKNKGMSLPELPSFKDEGDI
jgi:hypothetical protein